MKQSEIPMIRDSLLKKQEGICPICGKSLMRTLKSNVVIDHDHNTGIVRAVVHRGCNRVEGVVLNSLIKWGKAKSLSDIRSTLLRLIAFWDLHSKPQTDIVYYNHKTPAEKRLLAARKRRKKIANSKNN